VRGKGGGGVRSMEIAMFFGFMFVVFVEALDDTSTPVLFILEVIHVGEKYL
jgi:hypothetical protein